jgi:serine/threonine-protein kinase
MSKPPSKPPSRPPQKLVCRLAVEKGYLSRQQVRAAVRLQAKLDGPRKHISEVFLEERLLTRGQVEDLLQAASSLEAEKRLSGLPTHVPRDPSLPSFEEVLRPGERLDKYEILSVAGCGGMALVYRARHVEREVEVALKVMSADGFETEEAKARFLREARILAQLDHPNVVRFREFARLPHGGYYYTMDLVDGKDYQSILAAGPQPFEEAARTLATVADTVHYAHALGIVHRDLKPGNILIRADGTPLVTDFGLARNLLDKESARLTHTGMVLGTYAYMAPEQRHGDTKHTDERSDVYSLGAILYQAITGRAPPLIRDHFEFSRRWPRGKEPHPQGGVPEALRAICLQCLEEDPDERYPSAADVASDLRRFLEGSPVKAHPAPERPRTLVHPRASGDLPRLAIIAAGVALAVLALLIAAGLSRC